MSAIALRDNGTDFEPFASWYRKRPTQVAFVASLLVHAILIAAMPGFRSVPPDTPSVLTVQIVNEAAPPEKVVVPENAPEPKPVVRNEEPAPEPVKKLDLPAPPELVAPAPQPRTVEQAKVVPRPTVEPQPAPVVQQPDQPQLQDVARAELAPTVPQQHPKVQPVITTRPELAPQQPVVPVIPPQASARVEEPLRRPVDLRPQPPVVQQSPANVVRPQPLTEAPSPDTPVPTVAPKQIQPPVVTAPSAPAPVRQTAPEVPAQPQAPVAVAPPVTMAVAKPSAPVPVAAPAPPVLAKAAPAKPVVEPVEASVLEAYRQSVSHQVMQHMKYPMIAVRRKWQGKAVVEMQLSDDGSVKQLVVVESSGKEVLDDAALAMIRESLPLPKPPRGVRSVKVPVVFRLQG